MVIKNKIIIGIGIISILFIILFFSFTNSNSELNNMNILKTISLNDWKSIYDSNVNNNDYIILDVRTPEEYNQGHIENSININFYDSNFKEELNQLDKAKKYLIYCRSGSRSSKTLSLTKSLNFNEVYNLNGGIIAWNRAGFKTIK